MWVQMRKVRSPLCYWDRHGLSLCIHLWLWRQSFVRVGQCRQGQRSSAWLHLSLQMWCQFRWALLCLPLQSHCRRWLLWAYLSLHCTPHQQGCRVWCLCRRIWLCKNCVNLCVLPFQIQVWQILLMKLLCSRRQREYWLVVLRPLHNGCRRMCHQLHLHLPLCRSEWFQCRLTRRCTWHKFRLLKVRMI